MNKIEDFKIGMYVRISDDPTKSIKKFKGSVTKRRIAGSIQKITETRYHKNAIRVRYKGSNWTFLLDDITFVDESEVNPKPELFDVNNLI